MTYKFDRCKECYNPDHLLTVIKRAKRHLKNLYEKYQKQDHMYTILHIIYSTV